MAYNMYVCPNCRKVFKINGPGKKAKCPKCQDPLLVDTGAIEDDWKTYSPAKKDSIISHLLDEPEIVEIEESLEPEPEVASQTDNSYTSLFDFDDNQSIAGSPSPIPAPASKSFFDEPGMNVGSNSSSTSTSFYDNSSMDVQSSQPQRTYTQPPISPSGKNSKLSIIAFILSITGCLFIVGLILAIIDLKNKNDGFKHSFSYTSLILCGLWFILGLGINAFGGGSKKTDVADTKSSIKTTAEDSNTETIPVENDSTESSDGVTMPDLVGMSLLEASDTLKSNGLTAKASYVDSDAPKDSIVGQDVAAGETIEKHSVVTLEVSAGDSSSEDSESSEPSEPETPKEPEIPKDEYIASCEDFNYKAIARNPEEYKGKHFAFTAMISSAREGGFLSGYQKYYISYAFDEDKAQEMVNNGWAKNMEDAKIYGMDYDTCVWLLDNRNPSSPDYVKILENDIVKVYGTFTGMQETKNSLTKESGEEVSLDIKYVELLFE